MIPGLPPLVFLESVALSGAATVTIPASGTIAGHANFPAGGQHAVLVVEGISAVAGFRHIRHRLNSDSGTNYHDVHMDGEGSGVSASTNTGGTDIILGVCGSSVVGGGTYIIPRFANTTFHKNILGHGAASENYMRSGVGRWANTAAVTDWEIYPDGGNWVAGAKASLYIVDDNSLVDSETIAGSDAVFGQFSGWSAANGNLSIIGDTRSTKSAQSENMLLRINGDSTDGNYRYQQINANVSTISAGAGALPFVGHPPAASATSGISGALLATVDNYNGGDADGAYLSSGGWAQDGSTSHTMGVAGRWFNVAAITAIDILLGTVTNTFLVGSYIGIYGSLPAVELDRQAMDGGETEVDLDMSKIGDAVVDLRVNIYGQMTKSGTGDWGKVGLEFNGDTTDGNYHTQVLDGNGSGVWAGKDDADGNEVGIMPSDNNGDADNMGTLSILIPGYKNTSLQKHRLSISGAGGGPNAGEQDIRYTSSRWANTAAITAIKIVCTDSFDAGTIIQLEGLAQPALGWTGTVMGVANPGKVMGVERANIGKIMGVA